MQQSSVGCMAEKDLDTASIFESTAGYYVTSDSELAAAARGGAGHAPGLAVSPGQRPGHGGPGLGSGPLTGSHTSR